MDFDVIVAGAGPAGVATAVALVRQGHDPRRVLCLDRARFPRAKPCGGGLTGHAAAALARLGLSLRVPSVACRDGQLVYGRLRRMATLASPVHIVRREEFDADLVAQARDLGIEIREGEGLASFSVDAARSRVTVATTIGGSLRARVLVGADGAGSLVRRRLRTSYPASSAQPLRLARLELPAPRRLDQTMVYDFSAFVGGLRGYVWLFPVPGGRVNVGIMHHPSTALGGRALDRLLASALRRYGVELPHPARGWPAWPYDAAAPVSAAHLLCVGDAAGIDALTGEGIAVGFEQGQVAAGAITRALGNDDFAFSAYRSELRRAVVGRELALDDLAARCLYGSADYRAWLSLVMFDERMLALYAARVCGSEVLADHKLALAAVLARHLVLRPLRVRRLEAAGPWP